MIRKMIAAVFAVLILAGCATQQADEVSGDASERPDAGFVGEIGQSPGDESEGAEEEAEPEPEPLRLFEIDKDRARELLQADEQGTVRISTGEDLAALAVLVNAGEEEYAAYSYSLTGDLRLEGYDFTPIGNEETPFNAAFDGEGHLIFDLTVGEQGFAGGTGLFGAIGPDGSVRRTHVVRGNITGARYTGGFVGLCQGMVYDCSFNGSVSAPGTGVGGFAGALESPEGGAASLEMCAANATVSGTRNVGGLVGYLGGGTSVSDSYALGSVTAIEGEGESSRIGGLGGHNEGGDLRRAYSVTEVYTRTSSSLVGGFLGDNSGSVHSCYFSEAAVSNWKPVGNATEDEPEEGVAGCTVEELTDAATYGGWDFDNVWEIAEDRYRGLPFLR